MASKKKRSSRSSRRSRHGNAQQRRAPDRITALARETGLRRFGDSGGKFKQITSPDDAFAYAYHLGFAGSGPIVYRQAALASVVDALLAASGNESWYHKVFKPFGVRFKNHIVDGTGNRYPWLGTFTVKAIDGTTRTVNMRNVK